MKSAKSLMEASLTGYIIGSSSQSQKVVRYNSGSTHTSTHAVYMYVSFIIIITID